MVRNRLLVVAAVAATMALVAGIAPVDAVQDLPTFVRFIGTSGSGTTELDDPIAVDTDAAGRWYVADYLNDRIQVFGPAGFHLATISGPGSDPGELDKPNGLAVYPDASVSRERLVVSDASHDALQVFELNGTYVKTVSSFAGATPTGLSAPAGITVASDGRFAVADRLGKRVLVLSPTFTLLREIDLAINPFGVAFSPDDSTLYVSQTANAILTFDPVTGASKGTIDMTTIGGGSPYQLRVDDIGFLYLGLTSLGRVRKLSPAGTAQWEFGANGTGELQFSSPYDTLVTSDGLMAVAEVGNDRIQVLDLCPTGFPDVPDSHPFWFEICWMDTANVSTGFADGTYRPAQDVTRQAMAAFLARATGAAVPSGPATPTFTDVPTSHPFYDEIEWMADEGIADGFPDGSFRPTAPVSRQAMSAFMQRASGLPLGSLPGSPTFNDVGPAHAFYAEIEWMAANGVSTGFPDGTYRPSEPVTRQAMSAFLARLALIT